MSFLVGELACAVSGGLVDYERRFDFEISGFACAVEEELYEGALEASAFAQVYGKSGAGDFDSEVKVYDIVFLGQFPVRKSVFGQVGHRASGFFDNVVGGACTFGNHCAGQHRYQTEGAFRN